MKKVLVINANPKSDSLCKALAERYALAASNQHQVELIHLDNLDFAISLDQGYDTKTALEPDLLHFQQQVEWANHVVIVSPVWWGTLPAKFKGLIDRTFLPGFAFKYVSGKAIPKKLLEGRTSQLIFTLDTPPFWYKYIKGNAIYRELKRSILDFSGIKNQSATYFGPVISSDDKTRQAWLEKTEQLVNNC
ncbi:NAD(P)H dehydrogenase [Vibrio ponticus]|uniref:Flavodoxin family protein n=1 Tax=Vibrio ponticus TaxID=265668 RepID=A0A3N3E4Q8_9VIBR|nr:NAD(P)H-dependent oxidoreductase [Vibrio ponticus]OLQ94544.1 NAD(P)H dehydrogenase [Vibrio ponticus]ROV61712.1 flavodoxin family protein [Vibrio ponticus]